MSSLLKRPVKGRATPKRAGTRPAPGPAVKGDGKLRKLASNSPPCRSCERSSALPASTTPTCAGSRESRARNYGRCRRSASARACESTISRNEWRCIRRPPAISSMHWSSESSFAAIGTRRISASCG